jgi:TctA family transporter
MVFITRPISATLLGLGVLAIIAASIPALYRKRAEAFRG